MTKRNRKTLTENFSDGRLPSQEAFEDLIDSMVNVVDDGIEKTPQDGLKIAQMGTGDKLISFFDKIPVKEPLWSIAFSVPPAGADAGNQNLNLFHGNNPAMGLTLASGAEGAKADIRVGINNSNPQHAIDTEGVVASNGRIGREGGEEGRKVLADGEWHPIVTGLDGCHAFEIMAGVGKQGSGKYALVHAFALSTFNSKKGNITSHQAYYSSKCDQIELRWAGTAHNYSLEMRTRCSFLKKNARKGDKKDEIYVRYYITQLWFDSFMDGCASGQPKTKREHRPQATPAADQQDSPDTATPASKRERGAPSGMNWITNALKLIGWRK